MAVEIVPCFAQLSWLHSGGNGLRQTPHGQMEGSHVRTLKRAASTPEA